MKHRTLAMSGVVIAACLGAAPAVLSSDSRSTPMHATGTFDVDLAPQQADNPQAQAAGLTRISIAKRYHGDLEASGNGEMLATRDEGESGAYVAIEQVSGTLAGNSGEFTLVHSAVMRRGVPEDWSVEVVPDSGTGELAGLSGSMTITIEGERHSYELRYTLPAT